MYNAAMANESIYLKVVTSELKSLGLRNNPNILTYPVGIWVRLPPDQIVEGKGPWSGWGGIGVLKTLGGARGMVRYMDDQYRRPCLIYRVNIDRILYENDDRLKTDAVMLTEKIDFNTKLFKGVIVPRNI
jgi:hypothetical protein